MQIRSSSALLKCHISQKFVWELKDFTGFALTLTLFPQGGVSLQSLQFTIETNRVKGRNSFNLYKYFGKKAQSLDVGDIPGCTVLLFGFKVKINLTTYTSEQGYGWKKIKSAFIPSHTPKYAQTFHRTIYIIVVRTHCHCGALLTHHLTFPPKFQANIDETSFVETVYGSAFSNNNQLRRHNAGKGC